MDALHPSHPLYCDRMHLVSRGQTWSGGENRLPGGAFKHLMLICGKNPQQLSHRLVLHQTVFTRAPSRRSLRFRTSIPRILPCFHLYLPETVSSKYRRVRGMSVLAMHLGMHFLRTWTKQSQALLWVTSIYERSNSLQMKFCWFRKSFFNYLQWF